MGLQQIPSKGGIPSGNTASRPGSPVIGDTFYNGQLGQLEIYNGTSWIAVSAPPLAPTLATPTNASATNVYTTTAGALSVVFTRNPNGGEPIQYNAYTTSGGFSGFSSTNTVTITGLTPGTAYTVYGNVQNNFGTSTNSANTSAVTPSTLPQVPTIGTASAGNGSISLTFTPGNDGGSPITNYKYSLDGTTYTALSPADTTSPVIIPGLTNDTAYTVRLKAVNANGDSEASSASNSATPSNATFIDLIVVAGGGGGGFDEGSGGGAGGFRLLTDTSLANGVTYTVTVGSGGAGRSSSAGLGNPGVNSSFIGTGLSVSASGGGSGATAGINKPDAGGSGGGFRGSNVLGNAGGYTPPEGYQGGITSTRGAGGGGGAGAAAVDWTSGDSRGAPGGIGAGGTGYTNFAIIDAMGSATTSGQLSSGNYYFAGGGGAGAIGNWSQGGGYGGLGGGGNGSGSDTGGAQPGTANTGGGGGGASGWGGSSSGANAGSGIVILRYLDSNPAATSTTGSPSTVTTGGYRYYKFTGNGSITL